jgi:hypothetical protein
LKPEDKQEKRAGEEELFEWKMLSGPRSQEPGVRMEPQGVDETALEKYCKPF